MERIRARILTYMTWTVLVVFVLTLKGAASQLSDNSPPVLHVNRNWNVLSTEPIGSIVTRVTGEDHEDQDHLEFGLAQITDRPFPANKKPIPFAIDKQTGFVSINDTLEDRIGENIFVYVTLFDGQYTAKNEIWAKIVNGSNPRAVQGSGLYHPQIGFPPPTFNFPTNNFLPRVPSSSSRPPKKPTKVKNDEKIFNKTLWSSEKTEKPLVSEKNDDVSNNVVLDNSDPYSSKVAEKIYKDLPTPPPQLGPIDSSFLTTTAQLVFLFILCAAFTIIGIFSVILKKKWLFEKPGKTKNDMLKEPHALALNEDPALAMQQWRGPRAYSNRYESYDNRPVNSIEPNAPKPEADHWEFPRHRLKIFNILGEGAFGQVWKSEATDIDNKEGVSIVAVKTLKENTTEKGRIDLLAELDILKSLEPHPNVVRLLGSCTEKDPIFVIMEYVSKGKLQDYLRCSRAERCYGNMHGESKTLTSRDLTLFVYQVARGMQYISSKNIIHRDLAARNILITEDHVCKVADFGLARYVTDTSTMEYECKSDRKLPIRWMAPESLYNNKFTIQSDIWSFGVFIWEVVTLGSTPYPGLSAADVMKKVREGYRLEKPEHCRRELYNIMYYCWDAESQKRPSFTDCVALLEKLLVNDTDYIELERFPEHSYYNVSEALSSTEKI